MDLTPESLGTGVFSFIMGCFMKDKVFLTVDEQISLLKSKNLKFKDEAKAKELLTNIGYYKLINAYRIPFMTYVDGNHTFCDNAYFEDIVELYNFDRSLKTIVFEATTNIEIRIKSLLSQVFSKNYGVDNNLYLVPQNFESDDKTEYKFKDMKNHINSELDKQYKNEHATIKWYKDNYNYYPFWVVANILSLGSISKIFSKLKTKDQIEISKNYKLMNDYVASYIKHITLVRNLCAHNDVLYRYKSKNAIPQKIKRVKEIYEFLEIKKNEVTGRYEKGSNDFLSTIIIFKLMLPKKEYNDFKTKFTSIYQRLSKKIDIKFFEKIRIELGIVENWNKIK